MQPRITAALALVLLSTPAVPAAEDSTPVKRARALLEEGAADHEPDVRREVAVAFGLGTSRDPSTSILEKLASDKDHLVREAALVSIGELNDSRLAKPAHDALEDDVPEVAFAAARTLYKLKQPEGRELLIQVVEKEA